VDMEVPSQAMEEANALENPAPAVKRLMEKKPEDMAVKKPAVAPSPVTEGRKLADMEVPSQAMAAKKPAVAPSPVMEEKKPEVMEVLSPATEVKKLAAISKSTKAIQQVALAQCTEESQVMEVKRLQIMVALLQAMEVLPQATEVKKVTATRRPRKNARERRSTIIIPLLKATDLLLHPPMVVLQAVDMAVLPHLTLESKAAAL